MPEKRRLVLSNVLFATDSPSSLAALWHAEAIARRYSAKPYIVHVIPSDAYILVPPDKRDTALRQAQEYGEERLGALMQYSLFAISHMKYCSSMVMCGRSCPRSSKSMTSI